MTELLIAAGIILLLVVANGLFVAAEFAIVGAPRASIEHQASQGSRLAQRVARILEDPRRQDRYIATTQVGISVASLGLGMYGEHVIAQWIAVRLEPFEANRWIAAHAVASVVAVSVLTYLHIVIGEMVPKALALQRAARTVLYVSPFILVLEAALRPLIVGLNAIGNGLLRLVGVRRQEVDSERYHTTEELQYIIEESQEGGMLRGESGQILRELFEFGDLTAGETMVPRVMLTGIAVGTGPDELSAIVQVNPHTRYPIFVGDLDNIIGSLHIKEALRHLVANRPVTARDARPLPYVPGPAPLDEVARRHAALPRADGGGDGSAWRHRRPSHDGGPLRGGRWRHRRGSRPEADRAGGPGPPAGARNRSPRGGGNGAWLHSGSPQSDDDQRPGAAAARPAGLLGRRCHLAQCAD